MTSRNVTGICIPCTSCQHACQTAIAFKIDGDLLKVGSSAGVWYCVVVFNKG